MKVFWDRVLTAEQQKYIGYFYLRGGFDFSKLTAADKVLMKMLKVKLQKAKECVLEITPTLIKSWVYENDVPYIETWDLSDTR